MAELVRFGISLDSELLHRFDALNTAKHYPSRSEALRDLIRQELVSHEWQQNDRQVAGAITFVYDHHRRALLNQIIDIQHDFQQTIISTQHIHVDRSTCLEIIAVKGSAADIQLLADRLRALKGVRHGIVSMSSLGQDGG